MEKQKLTQRRMPRRLLVLLGAIAVAILLAAHIVSRSLPSGADQIVDPPGPTDAAPNASQPLLEYAFTLTGGQRLNEEPLPVSSLVSRGEALWVGSDLDGLFVLQDNVLTRVYDGVIYSLLPQMAPSEVERQLEGQERLMAGYAYFARREPVTEVAGSNGGLARLSRPVYLSDDEEEMGLGLWDGERWTSLWSQEAVWDLVYGDESRLYLSTNDGVYLFESDAYPPSGAAQAQHLGLAGTLCFGLLYDDAAQVLLVGTRGGIWRYDEATWQKVLDLPEEKVLDFARDEAGHFYAASTAGLFTSQDGVTWSQVGETISLRTVILAPNGIVAGGSGGVYVLRDGALESVNEHPQVRTLAWHNGRLYAGTNDGLWRLGE